MFNRFRSVSKIFKPVIRYFQMENKIEMPIFENAQPEKLRDYLELSPKLDHFLFYAFEKCNDIDKFLNLLNEKVFVHKNLNALIFENCTENNNSDSPLTKFLLKTESLKSIQIYNTNFSFNNEDFEQINNWKNQLRIIENNSLPIKMINNILANNDEKLEVFASAYVDDLRMKSDIEAVRFFKNLQTLKKSLKILHLSHFPLSFKVLQEYFEFLENSSLEAITIELRYHFLNEALSILLPSSDSLRFVEIRYMREENFENLIEFIKKCTSLENVSIEQTDLNLLGKLKDKFPNIQFNNSEIGIEMISQRIWNLQFDKN